ncbi:TPA: hypothetical protein LA462_000271 [Clostridium botulinum]|nr:hypothetical protein [Clostridium botulinum]
MEDNIADGKFKSILERYNKEVCPNCGKEIDRGDVCWNNPTSDGEDGGTPYCVIAIQCQACDTEIKSGTSWYPGADDFEELVDCALEDIFEE